MGEFKKRVLFFLEFLVFCFFLGVIEDVIAVTTATGESFSFHILWIVAVVTIPFSLMGEFLVDKTHLVPRVPTSKMDYFIKFGEFFVFGFLMNLAEDLFAILVATDHIITLSVVITCALVALPFALFSELVVDKIRVPIHKRIHKYP